MRRYLFVVSEAVAPAGNVGLALLENGAFYDTILPNENHASYAPHDYPGIPGDPGDYAGLIVMGGAMSANDVEDYPYLLDVESLIRKFDAAGRPVLGICLGAQVVARAYGGEVVPTGELETGFVPIALQPEAADDPLFSGTGPRLSLFQNHYDAVQHVPDAVVLASGDRCPIQAFRVGERVYGTQFHLEVTLDIARDWYRRFGHVLYRDAPEMEHELDAGFIDHFAAQAALCRLLVTRWMDLGTEA